MKTKSLMNIAIGTGAVVCGGFGLLLNGFVGALIGAIIGVLMIALYMPIFSIGQAVG